ncbi:efflux RND transporter periplasmic adaptor subunit [Pseudoduganella chitinolytica]|uniref:Efflux RND transporter periplasmic adaptor subunit n=1 Tax=Pseudoduganella chitinolytica TaxID=34070 RepID=A0ABY8BEL6_9BURK|nr:efflux RND transporter periplasmic adaptor subunit [Pseudoduganella chitinolytica]WEF33708.1 efflux RND transporter periplasmic adaptor subunit [Pseudoduganella chitinolytica]
MRRVIGLCVIAAAVSLAGAWLRAAPPAPAAAKVAATAAATAAAGPPVLVATVTPVRRDVPIELHASGTVTPASAVVVHARVTSRIVRVHVAEGGFVRAGQLMFTLDGRAAQAAAAAARARVLRAEAVVADLERRHGRAAELLASRFLAAGAVDTLQGELAAARAQLLAERAALQGALVDAGHHTIQAPMAGRVGAIDVHPGALAGPDRPLATVTRLDPIDVAFALPESAVADVLAAQRQGTVAVQAGAVPGMLRFVDSRVDPQAGAILVKARFDNRAGALWPGQYVATRVTVGVLRDALVIPYAAVVTRADGTFVYVVQADGTAARLPVRAVHAFGASVAITGLAGAERVVTEGKQQLRPGARVTVVEGGAT